MKKTNKYKIKAAQAQSDKLELMRDIATYENNMSVELSLRQRLLQMHQSIKEIKSILDDQSRLSTDYDLLQSNILDSLKTIDHWKRRTMIQAEDFLSQ